MERALKQAKDWIIQMWQRSNYDWMLSLTLLMAFTGVPTHDLMFIKLASNP